MQLFTSEKNILSSLNEVSFVLERDIQNLFESNLGLLTEYQFVASEFVIKSNRIDTLAFDRESNAFVIIEYKRDRNYSVIDQGYTYLSLLLEYKANFLVEYNERLNQNLRMNDIDWTQTKILFVAPSFSDNQKQAANFKDLPIELWEIKKFENDIVVINPVRKSKAAPSIKEIKAKVNSEVEKVSKELIVYTENTHIKNCPDQIRELYEAYKIGILNLDSDIEIIAKKLYIAFKKKRNVADIVIMKNSLKLFINKPSGTLDDPKGLMRNVSSIGHWGNGDYEVIISDTSHIEYIMFLIKQAL